MDKAFDNSGLEQALRSGAVVQGGFLGSDPRPLTRIIEEDLRTLEGLGYTPQRVAQRMAELTAAAAPRLESWYNINDNIRVRCEEVRGVIVCPWPHAGRFDKRITIAHRLDLDRSIRWTDLNIHLIGEHSFFEGRGSHFRLDPDELIGIIFTP